MKHIYTNKYLIRSFLQWASLKTKILFIFLIVIVSFSGTNDEESFGLYINKLQSLSIHKIDSRQKNLLTKFYIQNDNRNPNKYHRHQMRKIFNQKRRGMKQDWEVEYHIEWPHIVSNKTTTFEAHHVVPINAGGINVWWNISPLLPKNHKLIHESLEEQACFSHNVLKRQFLRFVLRIKSFISPKFKKYAYQNKSYYKFH